MGYQDLTEEERGRVREQFYAEDTTREKRVELIRLMQNSADEVKMGRPCARCKHYPFFVPHDEALLEGHVYSQAGMQELPISGYCEFCFDLVTKEPDEETRGDDWKQHFTDEEPDFGERLQDLGVPDDEIARLMREGEDPLPPL